MPKKLKAPPLVYLGRDARLSDCGTYRYTLSRIWEPGLGNCLFVMLNPSTADALADDPTIRRCVGFARAWGYGSLSVVNLFALRATDPKALYRHADPVGPDNDAVIAAAARVADVVVAAWGAHGTHRDRGDAVARLIAEVAGRAVHRLSLTGDGQPGHPLYLKADLRPVLYSLSDGGA